MPSAAPRSSLSVRLPAVPLDHSDDSPWHKSSPSQVRKTPIGGVSAKRPWPALILAIGPPSLEADQLHRAPFRPNLCLLHYNKVVTRR